MEDLETKIQKVLNKKAILSLGPNEKMMEKLTELYAQLSLERQLRDTKLHKN